MAALEHIDEIRKLTKGQVSHTGLIQYIRKNADGFRQYINHMLLTQYRITKWLWLFKSEGIDAVLKELKQMHTLKCVDLLHPSQVTKDMRQEALNYLIFLTQKKTGIIKGRGYADRRKQKAYIKKEDSAAPTVALAALFQSCIQDSTEHQFVVTVDIPGAFLQTDQPEDDEGIIRFDGPMVEVLVKINPAIYKDKIQIFRYLWYSTGSISILVRPTRKPKEMGFKANPYDCCTMNRMFGKDQCTIQWHVPRLKFIYIGLYI